MKKRKFSEQFRLEIVEQVTGMNKSVAEVSDRYGVSHNTIYKWIKLYGKQK